MIEYGLENYPDIIAQEGMTAISLRRLLNAYHETAAITAVEERAYSAKELLNHRILCIPTGSEELEEHLVIEFSPSNKHIRLLYDGVMRWYIFDNVKIIEVLGVEQFAQSLAQSLKGSTNR